MISVSSSMKTIQTTFATGIVPWQFTPVMLKPVNPVKAAPAPKPAIKYLPVTASDVARYVEQRGTSITSDVAAALCSRVSTICEIFVRLEQDGYMAFELGHIETRNYPVKFWTSIRKYDAPPSRHTVIRNWIKTHPWRSAGQIGKSLGFDNMSSSMRRLVSLGDVIERDMPNPHGLVIKHYAIKGTK